MIQRPVPYVKGVCVLKFPLRGEKVRQRSQSKKVRAKNTPFPPGVLFPRWSPVSSQRAAPPLFSSSFYFFFSFLFLLLFVFYFFIFVFWVGWCVFPVLFGMCLVLVYPPWGYFKILDPWGYFRIFWYHIIFFEHVV